MEKIEFTKEQIEKIAEGISVICFRSNSEAKKFVLLEYPKPKDVFFTPVSGISLSIIRNTQRK